MSASIESPIVTSNSLKRRVWCVLHCEPDIGKFGRAVNLGLIGLILLNVFAVIAETMPIVSDPLRRSLWGFELFSIGVFSIEYVLRLWSCTADPMYSQPILGRMRYSVSFLAMVDLLSIVPFYLPASGLDLLPLRLFRLLRLVRVFKLGRYSESLKLIGLVIKNKRTDLISTGIVALLLLVVSATILHAAEGQVQPKQFGTLPDCMWWAVTTMTTVGYGDAYPITPEGKLLGGCVAFIGIGMFALPAAILGAGFLEERHKREHHQSARTMICPRCGYQMTE